LEFNYKLQSYLVTQLWETACWASNSPNVNHRHYKALVKEADAKEFWEITPTSVGKILPLPAAVAQ
jgi:hypothetical protein